MSGTSPTDPHGRSPYGDSPYGRPAPDAGDGPGAAGPDAVNRPGASPYGENPYGALPRGQSTDGVVPQSAPSAAGPGGWPSSAPGPAPARPASLTAAFWLILSGGLVLLASTLLAAFALSLPEARAMVREELERSNAQLGLTAEQMAQVDQLTDQVLPLVGPVAAGFGVVAFLLYLLIASKIRGGSRAARTVGTVLAALSVLMLAVNLTMGAFNPLDLLWVGLGVAGIVMAYRPEATEYMRLKAWERAGTR